MRFRACIALLLFVSACATSAPSPGEPKACGYRFVVGVRSKAHKEALLKADNTLDVVVMDWC
jgi:uncharacterized protein DUF6310